jgi:hypothetical protein
MLRLRSPHFKVSIYLAFRKHPSTEGVPAGRGGSNQGKMKNSKFKNAPLGRTESSTQFCIDNFAF